MTAPTGGGRACCARRSNRAISKAGVGVCSTASGGSGPVRSYGPVLLEQGSDSSTTLVNSSMNSGTPSVLRTTSSSTAAGKALLSR